MASPGCCRCCPIRASSWSDRRCATAPSSSIGSTEPAICPAASARRRVPAPTGSNRPATTGSSSGRTAPTPRSGSCSRRAKRSRPATATPTASSRSTPASLPDVRYAFIGLRACDLAAIEIQDKVFLIADPAYRARREQAVFIGVNCGAPGETCFCVSMGTGPRCSSGFDVALTELDDGFTAEAGTAAGAELLDRLDAAKADRRPSAASHRVSEIAASPHGPRAARPTTCPGCCTATASTPVGTRWARAA